MSFWGKIKPFRSHLLTYFLAISAVFITIATVKYPKDAFDSAIMGLNLWWNIVFPSLLPFFILSEILMGLGVVHFIGVLLEPLMRPLFRVPGMGAFAMSMGLASGYPMDAVITCKFRKNKLCTAVEAERLLAFTNTADPLFMFGAVAVGMFGMPEIGTVIAAAHYLASFLVGILYRYHGKSREHGTGLAAPTGNILLRACQALYNARREDKRSVGELLGDAVKSSMNTILLIGGFIIIFSVFIKILSVVGATNILTGFFTFVLHAISFDSHLAPALVSGLFEIDLGTLAASQAEAPFSEKVAIASAIIAWSGLSVHGQVASIVIESGIRMAPYMIARLLHAIIAAILTLLFLGPAHITARTLQIPVMLNIDSNSSLSAWLFHTNQVAYQCFLILSVMLALSLSIHLLRGLAATVSRR